jgi:hypothetical protein
MTMWLFQAHVHLKEARQLMKKKKIKHLMHHMLILMNLSNLNLMHHMLILMNLSNLNLMHHMLILMNLSNLKLQSLKESLRSGNLLKKRLMENIICNIWTQLLSSGLMLLGISLELYLTLTHLTTTHTL